MNKNYVAVMLAVVLAGTLTACGPGNGKQGNLKAGQAGEQGSAGAGQAQAEQGGKAGQTQTKAELALVTDLGTIDDKSFNQGAWEGMSRYAQENNISYKYYQPQEGTTDSYLETIGLAVEGGAKLVVCPGFLFEEPIFKAQEEYPQVHFILLDGEPHDADYNYKTGDNVMPILFAEDQAGFLAGYGAVKEGYTKLGFMGGLAVPAVIRFGYGFVQGADLAAREDNIQGIQVMYNYTGGFSATPEAQSMAASWYQNGTEVIFGCGGAVGNSVMAAAQEKNGRVIGVDVDQSTESDTVMTSAMKLLSNSVYTGVKAYYEGEFPGGETAVFSASNQGVGLPMETSRFQKFDKEQYEGVYGRLSAGEIVLEQFSKDNNNPAKDLTGLTQTEITFVE